MMKYPRQRLNVNFGDFVWLLSRLFKRKDYGDLFKKQLGGYLKAKNVVLTPSATYSFYKILKFYGAKEIVLPARVYPSFFEVAKLIGTEINLIETNEETLNIDYRDAVKKDVKGKVVLVPLYYGNIPKDFKKIVRYLKKKNCRIIIDSVQYFEADEFLLKNADAIIYSFSRAKDLDLLGGGAVACNSKELRDYLEKELRKNKTISKAMMLKNILKYFYIWFFTNKVVFPLITHPLLLLNSFFKKEVIGNAPRRLFGEGNVDLRRLERSRKMCNLQFLFGIRKLKDAARLIKKRKIIGDKFYNFVLGAGVSVPANEKSIYYTFPLINKGIGFRKKLLRRGIDSKKAFLKDCSVKSTEISKKLIHIAIYDMGKIEFIRFKRRFLKALE